jgi:uncharacterized protein
VRPLPVPDETSAGYWEAARRHELHLARCSVCGLVDLPPGVVCSHCLSTTPDFTYAPMSGRGTVRSWTIMRDSFVPGFEADLPFVLVDVELEEQAGLRLIGRLLDGPDAPLSIGAAVHVAFEDLTPEVALPAFALDATG